MKTYVFLILLPFGTALAQAPEPARTAETAAPKFAAVAAGTTDARKVDVNTAEIPTLEAVPEIGTNFANAVFSSRPFKSLGELNRILKLPPDQLDQLRNRVTFSAMKPAAPTRPDGVPTGTSKPPKVKEGKATPRQEVTERYEREAGGKSAADDNSR